MGRGIGLVKPSLQKGKGCFGADDGDSPLTPKLAGEPPKHAKKRQQNGSYLEHHCQHKRVPHFHAVVVNNAFKRAIKLSERIVTIKVKQG